MKLTVGSKNFIHFIPESGHIMEEESQQLLNIYCNARNGVCEKSFEAAYLKYLCKAIKK